jgi:hypothetical protein
VINIKYNTFGEDISEHRLEVANDEFGYVDEKNIPHINWRVEDELCDNDGFDKTYRPIHNSEVYLIRDYILTKGTIICRYGTPYGRFTTVKGTDYDMLGLPYKIKTIEYHEYQVTEDLSVECVVDKGLVAPQFNSMGGAIQFKHKQMITLECEDGCLKEVSLWKHQNI